MSQIRISSPTAAAAFVLRDLLGERGVTASPLADGTWEVVMNLDGSGARNPFDRALGSTRLATHLRAPWHPGQRRSSDALTRGRESGSGRRIDVKLPPR